MDADLEYYKEVAGILGGNCKNYTEHKYAAWFKYSEHRQRKCVCCGKIDAERYDGKTLNMSPIQLSGLFC